MTKIYLLLLFLVGLINFLPILGVISLDKINQAYGLSATDNNLEVLLRHRALLFGLVGGFIIFSVFNPQYQMAAMIFAAISMLGYLIIFWSVGDLNAALLKVAQIDIVGVILLLIAISIKYFNSEL
jgi:hypothetical protein